MSSMLPGVKYTCYLCDGTGDYRGDIQIKYINNNDDYIINYKKDLLKRLLLALPEISDRKKEQVSIMCGVYDHIKKEHS